MVHRTTNPLRTLNGRLGNGCVFGAAETKGTKARIIHSLVINKLAVTVELRPIKRENEVHMMVKTREPSVEEQKFESGDRTLVDYLEDKG